MLTLVLGEVVLQAGVALARGFGEAAKRWRRGRGNRLRRRGLLANRAQQFGMALRLARRAWRSSLQPADLGRQALEPIAAVLGDAALQLALPRRAAPGVARRCA
jgi:hypothetical protein